jgi:hypothetical protein
MNWFNCCESEKHYFVDLMETKGTHLSYFVSDMALAEQGKE